MIPHTRSLLHITRLTAGNLPAKSLLKTQKPGYLPPAAAIF